MGESLTGRIRRHEGLVLHPKPDAKGFYEIGYGHDITEQEASNYPDGCTLEDAENWLEADIQKAIDSVDNALPWVSNLSQLRAEVLYEMAYLMGVNGLLAFRNTLVACKAGNYAQTAQGMLGSLWHDQTPKRAEELAEIMLTNEEQV